MPLPAIEMAAAYRRRAKIAGVCILAALFAGITALVVHARQRQRIRPNHELFSLEQLAPAARVRDPFACGQALKYFADGAEGDARQRADFIGWCCLPPVDDMSGYVKMSCDQLLRDK
jgi:hypothetical protein